MGVKVFTAIYRQYVLAALTAVYTLGFLDQGLINLLVEPIEKDLRINDAQMGFLTGTAFGLFFATMAVPFARWSDRGDRSLIASIAIGFWGATVMLCFYVTNYTQLLLARVAAAVGGAGCMPPTHSLLGDFFESPRQRTRAMAIYMLANPL